jgi:hypothetical protein
MALRPEGTAPIVRAFVQHHPPAVEGLVRHAGLPLRAPRPGRYRQHHQLGVEALGPADADLDVEVISLADGSSAGSACRQVDLKLNSMGDGTCRPAYVELLRDFLAEHGPTSCARAPGAARANPLRVLDCKRPSAGPPPRTPRTSDHLCDPVPGALRPGAGRARRARRALHHRPPPGPGLRLLHPHHLRVRLGRPRRRPRTASAAAAATTAWWRCSAAPHARASASARDRAHPAGL